MDVERIKICPTIKYYVYMTLMSKNGESKHIGKAYDIMSVMDIINYKDLLHL